MLSKQAKAPRHLSGEHRPDEVVGRAVRDQIVAVDGADLAQPVRAVLGLGASRGWVAVKEGGK